MGERSGSDGANADQGTAPPIPPPPQAKAGPTLAGVADDRSRRLPEARPLAPPSSGETPYPTAGATYGRGRRPRDLPGRWDWRHATAGAIVAFAPTFVLYLLAMRSGNGASVDEVSVVSAIAIALGSLVTYGWQIAVAWGFSLRLSGNHLADWGFRRAPLAALWMVPLSLACVYAVAVVHDLLVHPPPQDILGEFPHSTVGIALFVLVAVVMAPLFEEIFFRGFLYRGFTTSWGWRWGAVASSTVFALAHAQLSVFVPIFGLGFALAWLYQRTSSLWPCIALHMVFNAISVTAWALS